MLLVFLITCFENLTGARGSMPLYVHIYEWVVTKPCPKCCKLNRSCLIDVVRYKIAISIMFATFVSYSGPLSLRVPTCYILSLRIMSKATMPGVRITYGDSLLSGLCIKTMES